MIWWVMTFFTGMLFVLSVINEKRQFKNAIFLLTFITFLFFGLIYNSYEHSYIFIYYTFLGTLYIIFPLCLLIVSTIFIKAGIISIKKEGLCIPHCLSIAFGIGIWMTMYCVVQILNERGNMFSFLIVLIGMYIIFTFISLFLYSNLYKIFPKNTDKCDFIIIHGAGLLRGCEVSPLLAGRLDKGLEIYEKCNKRAKFITSGGMGGDETISEALAMKKYLLEKGIDEEDIILEDKSVNTLENVINSKKIIEKMSGKYVCIFVTNDYHVFRTSMYTKNVGLKAEGVGCKTASYFFPNAFIREYIAIIIKYKIFLILLICFWFILFIVSLT